MTRDDRTSLEWPGAPSTAPHPLRRRLRQAARRLLAIAPEETSFARRGFRCDDDAVRRRLEGVADTFVQGYHFGLEESRPGPLAERLESLPVELRGFAYEGAGMALQILDTLAPWRPSRLRAFLDGPADAHVYIVHIGAGWALARLPLSPERLRARFDRVRGWLTLDGYGFHEGFFHPARTVARQRVPAKVRGYARRAFDQGLGRSLWFVEGADPGRIHARISAFPAERQADLWSGTGLACTYAGGRDRTAIERLKSLAGPHAAALAQGAAFAAVARYRAGYVPPQTDLACEVLGGASAEEMGRLTLEEGADLPRDGDLPGFEVWRRRIQERISKRSTAA